VVTGATSVTSTAFVGALTGNVTGNASGTALTVTQAAQSAITSVGTLTALTVDDVVVDGKVITMTGSSGDTFTTTVAANGATSLVTVDAAGAAANLQITADGTVDIDSAGVLTLDSGVAINIEPGTGSSILLDGTIAIDGGVVTGATSITSTAFVGALTGNVAGNLTGTVATATQNSITTATGLVSVGALDSGTITSGFGAIDNGTSNIRSATITAETAFVPDANDGSALGTTSLGFSDLFLADSGKIHFGNDQDVLLTHVADTGLVISVVGNTDTLTLKTADTDANNGPILKLSRDNNHGTDGDECGTIVFQAEDAADNLTNYVRMIQFVDNRTDGGEDGQLKILSLVDGTERNRIDIDGEETVFNEDSVDVDFRIESNGDANAFKMDATNGFIGFGQATPLKMLHITEPSSDCVIILDHNNTETDMQIVMAHHYGAGNDGAHYWGVGVDGSENDFVIGYDASSQASMGADQLLTIQHDGDVEISKGDLIFGTAGKGIVLGATSNTAANTLDDYEEGTFTATLTGSSAAPNTAVTSTGSYTKIGRVVNINIIFDNKNTTGASGDAYVTGLPFTAALESFGSYIAYGSLAYANNAVNTAVMATASNTRLEFFDNITSGAWHNSTIVAGSGKYIYLSLTYRTA